MNLLKSINYCKEKYSEKPLKCCDDKCKNKVIIYKLFKKRDKKN